MSSGNMAGRALRVFGMVIGFGLGLGVLSPTVAEAAPTATAQDELYWAFSACSNGLETHYDHKKQEGFAEYKERKAKAVKADASITSFNGKVKDRFAVQEWLKKCDVDLAAQSTAANAHQRAEEQVRLAGFACSDGKKGNDEGQTKYSAAKDAALKADPNIVKDDHGGGQTVGQFFAACDKEIPAAIAARKKDEAEMKKFHEEQAKKSQEEHKKAQEEAEKYAAKMKKLLKGDRWRIWDREGDPSDYPGDHVQVASYWDYTVTPANTSFSCTVRYRFKGNKLVKKSKSGTGCILVD